MLPYLAEPVMNTSPWTMVPGRGRGNVDAGSASVTGSPQSTLTLYHGLPVSSLRATSAACTTPVMAAWEVELLLRHLAG